MSEAFSSTDLKRARLQKQAYEVASNVLDPVIPVVTVGDLGILRGVVLNGENQVVVEVTPTYSACPAVVAIELAIEAALRKAGFEPEIRRVISPAWTTDWITPKGRQKLKEYGIAPPQESSNSKMALFGQTLVTCPRCESGRTQRISEFGSTACKAQYSCLECYEPFDYFKCI